MSWPLLPSSRAKTCMRYLPSGMKNCTACCPAVCTGSGASLRRATATFRQSLPCAGLGSASQAARCFSMLERSLADSPASRVSMSASPVDEPEEPEAPAFLLSSPAAVVAIRFAPVVPGTTWSHRSSHRPDYTALVAAVKDRARVRVTRERVAPGHGLEVGKGVKS